MKVLSAQTPRAEEDEDITRFLVCGASLVYLRAMFARGVLTEDSPSCCHNE